MDKLLFALDRQINIENARIYQRDIRLASGNILRDVLPPNVNPEYLEELKKGYTILEYFNTPIEARKEFDLPEKLTPLFNQLLTQLRFHTISGKDENETVMHMVNLTEQFFHDEFIPELKFKL